VGGLICPYGSDIVDDTMYVASFMTDQILMHDTMTGIFVVKFAKGDGMEEGLCNGPNQIAIYDGMLYLMMQGSVVVDGMLQYGLSSQVVVYDLATGMGAVNNVPQPEVLEGSNGLINMLAAYIGCESTIMTLIYAVGVRPSRRQHWIHDHD
jgi:hypothetical protein